MYIYIYLSYLQLVPLLKKNETKEKIVNVNYFYKVSIFFKAASVYSHEYFNSYRLWDC
jgi:hypothetical protein